MEKAGQSFKAHQDHEHDFWKYCNYLTYLMAKDKEELNGFETLVWNCYVDRKANWIPTYQGPSDSDKLENAGDDDIVQIIDEPEDDKKVSLESLKVDMDSLKSSLELLQSSINSIAEKKDKPE